jgi:hypothetical protein
MKKLAALLMVFSLALFNVGCEPADDAADPAPANGDAADPADPGTEDADDASGAG